MKNVEMTVEGNILIIKVDLTKDFGPSSSKKSIIIASTEGNVSVPNREEKVSRKALLQRSSGLAHWPLTGGVTRNTRS